MKATLYRRFDDVLVALFRACADIKAKQSLSMIGIKKEMFHNSHLFYESLAEGFEKQYSTGPLPTAQQASDGSQERRSGRAHALYCQM